MVAGKTEEVKRPGTVVVVQRVVAVVGMLVAAPKKAMLQDSFVTLNYDIGISAS